MQTHPLAMHLNGIAVDHRGDAGHVGQGGSGEQAQGDGEGAHSVRLIPNSATYAANIDTGQSITVPGQRRER